MKAIEFFVTVQEGEITSSSNEEARKIYNIEMNKYWSKRTDLFNLAYPNKNKEDLFDIGEPIFDIDKKMIEDGYFVQSLYSYSPEDGENGHGIYETPFAKIETFILNDKLFFVNSDGVCLATHKIKITLK